MAILIGVTAALLLAAALLLGWLLSRERHPRGGRISAPPMVFLPPEGSEPPIVRPPRVSPSPHVGSPDDGLTRPQLIHERGALEAVASASAAGASSPSAAGASSPSTVPVESATVAINRRRIPRNRPQADGAAAMGTLRMLPGRLVPEDRHALRDDIRFIALDTTGEQRFTLGRGDGPPHEHIQIGAPTVSRRHATMLFAGGAWSIANLSETNPVRVNGIELNGGGDRSLSDGDLVEMGDLVLRFRS